MGILGKIQRKLGSRYKTGVVFTHTQKCGGSSIEAALFRHYRFSREQILPIQARSAIRAVNGPPGAGQIPEMEALAFRQQLIAYALQRGVKCVSGHAPMSPALREAYAQHWKFVTILREPVARFCSHVRYGYRSGMETAVSGDIDAFLDGPRAQWFGGLYAAYFGGWADCGEPITQAAIDQARALILSYDVVGFLDKLADFQNDVSGLLQANIQIGHRNRTTDRTTSWRGEFTDRQMEKITSFCRPNIEIYEYVRERVGV